MKKKPKQRLTIPIHAPDTEMGRPPFHYDEILETAMLPNLEAMEELHDYFTQKEKIIHRRASHHSHPKLKHLTTIYQYLRDQLKRAITYVQACHAQGKTPQIEIWHHYQNHHARIHPHFGPFSLYDIAQLIESVPHARRGIKELMIPNYGTIDVTSTGWHLTMTDSMRPIERDGIPVLDDLHEFGKEIKRHSLSVDEETLHRLLVNVPHVERIPFTNACVLPSQTTGWKAPLDGMSVVVPAQTFSARDGETIEWDAIKRVSMLRSHYEALVYSVAFARYNDVKGSMDVHEASHLRTIACFGTSRLPRNSHEVEAWLYPDHERGREEEEYKEGTGMERLDEIQEEAMGDLEDHPF